MEFRILGPVEVEAGGQTLRLGGPKQRALLALLLTQVNRVVSVDRLTEGLWGDSPPDSSSTAIQVYISELRRLLEPDRQRRGPYLTLISQSPGYCLRIAPDQLDLFRFEQLKGTAARALAMGDFEAAATAARQALALWRGPALADFASEPWALGEAGRINQERMQVLEQRIHADLALGRHADLVAELEALVAEHPLREQLGGHLMLALYRSGRQAEASEVFQRTRERLVEQLGMEPGPELQKLLKRILNQDPGLNLPPPPLRPAPPPPGRLPAPLTSFIGREAELEKVRSLLAKARLVTLLGVGGVGKTRLAIEVGNRQASGYEEGVRYVDLAPLATPHLLSQAVVGALGLRDQANEDVAQVIVNHLAAKQVLLVLDNCEHVAEASARLVDRVLTQCAEVRVLATSRETLGVPGESVYRLQGLPLESDSVSLFLDRVQATAPALHATPDHERAISQICERLEGLPLAIELAASRVTVMSPPEILKRLDRRLDLLTTGPRTVPDRQRTLAATIDWSYGLLTEPEQRLFRQLSVFRGWFGVDAVEHVFGGVGQPLAHVTDLLARLIDKSMLVPGAEYQLGRCRMLETVREFGLLCLAHADEVEATAGGHADHYLAVVENASHHLRTPDQRRWLDLVADDYDNIRAALDWVRAREPERGLKAAASLENFWFHGRQNEGRFWLARFLEATPGRSGSDRADALYVASWLAWMQADFDSAQRTAEELVAISARSGDQFNRGRGRRYLACVAYSREDRDLAANYFAEALPDLRSAGTPWELAIALNDNSYLLHDLGRTEEARATLEESLALAQEAGDPWLLGMITESVATFAMLRGDVAEARRLWHECLQIEHHMGNQWSATFVVDGLAGLALQEGQAARSLCLMGASSALRDDMGSKPIPTHQRTLDEVAAGSRALLDPQTAEAAWESGRKLSWAELVDYALQP